MNINIVIEEIIENINKFINKDDMALDEKASFIMGATMFRDDYDDIKKIEPLIEELAEMASDFEVYYPNHGYNPEDFLCILEKIDQIRNMYKIKK